MSRHHLQLSTLCQTVGHVGAFDVIAHDMRLNSLKPPSAAPRWPNKAFSKQAVGSEVELNLHTVLRVSAAESEAGQRSTALLCGDSQKRFPLLQCVLIQRSLRRGAELFLLCKWTAGGLASTNQEPRGQLVTLRFTAGKRATQGY